MAKHIKVFACYFRLNLSSALEYRASFISQALGMALSNSSFIFFWWVAFDKLGGMIAGYGFGDVLFIWAAASSAFGLSRVLFANVSGLTGLIVTGELDTFLLQPCGVLMGVLCSRTSLSSYGDLAYGFIIMGVFRGGDASAWLWFAVAVAIGALLSTAITLTAHSLTFFLGDASAIGQLATEFAINFSIYPEKIYAPAVRALMYSLIPIGIAIHVPLRMAARFSAHIALAGLGGAALYCAFAGWLFYRGLRRYESGNVIVTRQ
ncbi:MAG: ABC-2 family transporter protein [Oscillospiraceae bacterium]|nr:ABC-2 family transporter protein [Oscillospiraceae bacterium]